MRGIESVQEPYKGCLLRRTHFGASRGEGESKADRYSGAPAGEAIRRLGGKARERRAGEILPEAFGGIPSKGETHGSSQRAAS